MLDIFSGRPNPIFTLSDSAAISAITHQAYISTNRLLDSTIVPDITMECLSHLEYRGLSMYGMFTA